MASKNALDMPEGSIQNIIDKIKALAVQVRNDYSDPSAECKAIVRLCEYLKENIQSEPCQ